ncbi:sodium:proton antiporter [Ectothiorhodospiraceae bacterium WFHF3C12]|nr:sodium:proton antiporter [Ectothiorhodospiraceae bacterium WFHF3C12]
MGLFDLAALVVSLAAVFAYLNHRFIGLPTALGVMLLALAVSVGLLMADGLGIGPLGDWARSQLGAVDFPATVLEGMLSFLLFAGALFVDFEALARRRYIVATLATLGVLLSTLLVAAAAWVLFRALGLDLPMTWCLVFGALISPTDPIAVLGILKTAGVPRSLETKIVGESLFNDGVAVVVFIVMLQLAVAGEAVPAEVGLLFLQEAVGGAAFGFALGWIAHRMLRGLDQYQVEVLISLAVVMGGYALAHALHLSGPIAMVVAGLMLGNHRPGEAMSDRTREHLHHFWELVDEVLNAVLFVLIGLEVLIISFDATTALAAALLIPVVVAVRLVSVGVPVGLLSPFRAFSPGVVPILTWGGLRGGISVALVLSLPAGEVRDLLLPVTYAVVLFSLIVQGLTIGPLARHLAGGDKGGAVRR